MQDGEHSSQTPRTTTPEILHGTGVRRVRERRRLGWRRVLLTIENSLLAILLGVFAGGAVAIGLLATGTKGRKDPVPFGPFLALGGMVSLLWGDKLLAWYLGRFLD